MPPPPLPIIAALSVAFELQTDAQGIVTTEAHILPVGPFRAVDGRPQECDAWQLDGQIAGQVIARLKAKANDSLIDYEHQSLKSDWNGQPVLAAGWFQELEWREGAGLYAVNIAWTDTAKSRIAAKEYRYISAVFTYLSGTGEILEIISIALTNTPAIDGLDALADLSKKFNSPTLPGGTMSPEQIAALTQERDTAKTQLAALTATVAEQDTRIAALTAENTVLATKVQTAEQATVALNTSIEADKKAALIKAALSTGKLVPTLKEWAEGRSLADLTQYLGAVDPVSLAMLQHKPEATAGDGGLTTEELAMCTKMGVTTEQFKLAQGK